MSDNDDSCVCEEGADWARVNPEHQGSEIAPGKRHHISCNTASRHCPRPGP